MAALETAPAVQGAPGKRTPGRAGRDLPAAIAVGVTLATLVVVPLYSPARWTFLLVLVAAAWLGTWELVKALRIGGCRPPLVPLLAGGAAMTALGYYRGAGPLFLVLLATVGLCLLWRLAGPVPGMLADVASAGFAAAYVPFLIGFAAMLAAPADGPRRVTVFIATVVCSDVGGYAAGVLYGKHPMAPTVSPKKSWEGFAGSLAACAVGGAVMFATLLHAPALLGAAYGLAICVTATLGDLGESMIKRDLGIKDMGTLLPGHGGLMDRLDSLLPSAAVAWLLLTAFVPLP